MSVRFAHKVLSNLTRSRSDKYHVSTVYCNKIAYYA